MTHIGGLRHVVLTPIPPTDYGVGGSGLLAGPLGLNALEFNGVGIDFSYPDVQEQCRIKDTVTPANDFRGNPASELTYTSPSVKNTRRSSGLYAATNGTTDLPYEWDATGKLQGLLIEKASTNLCLQASDFTNASWTKVNMTTAKTATGPDGVANSASTLTATAANATALQAIVSGSASRISSMFVKRRTGSGTINITQDNGTVWTVVTVTSGWTRVQSTNQTLTNPTVGVRIVTNGDAIDVVWFQQEISTFITSPIATTAASVTRAVDDITLASTAFPLSATEGTFIVNVVTPDLLTRVTSCMWGTVGTEAHFLTFSTTNPNYNVWDGTQQTAIDAGTVVAGVSKFGGAFAVNNFAASYNGGAVVTDVVGTLPTITRVQFGAGDTVSNPVNGYLQQLTYIARRLANAELETKTR